MAYSRSHINTCGSFNTGEKSALLKTFDEVDSGSGGGVTPTAAPAALTNSTGGTANDTVQAVPQTVPGEPSTGDVLAADLNPILTIVNNDIADLTVKINALRTALIASGILT